MLLMRILCHCSKRCYPSPAEEETEKGYLTYESEDGDDFSLKASNGKSWDGTMEYSTDTVNWTEWNGEEIYSENGKLYMRGTGNTVVSNGKQFVMTEHVTKPTA